MWCVGDRVKWVADDALNGLCGTIIESNGEKVQIHWDTDICSGRVGYMSYNKNLQLASYDDFFERIKERLE